MGTVWVADHLAFRTRVAVKFLLKGDLSAVSAEIFWAEAAAASQVKSPHVVQMLGHGESPGGRPFIVMELLEGEDLASYAKRNGPLPHAEAFNIVTQVARALARAHEIGIVHRDIKPSNLFVCDVGGELFVKVLDFGIARSSTTQTSALTESGHLSGTLHYMSPEQLAGDRAIDARSDGWAVGVLAYELLVGSRPFAGTSVCAQVLAVQGSTPSARRLRPDLPEAFDRWFARACAVQKKDRFSSVVEATNALRAALVPEPRLEFPLAVSSAAAMTHGGSSSQTRTLNRNASCWGLGGRAQIVLSLVGTAVACSAGIAVFAKAAPNRPALITVASTALPERTAAARAPWPVVGPETAVVGTEPRSVNGSALSDADQVPVSTPAPEGSRSIAQPIASRQTRRKPKARTGSTPVEGAAPSEPIGEEGITVDLSRMPEERF